MEDGRSSKIGNIMPNKLKILFFHYSNRKDREHQEVNEYMIKDNISHMLIVSIILVIISVTKIILRASQMWRGDIGIVMLFITLTFGILWYFIHNGMIQSLKIQQFICITFWISINIAGLRELYTEIHTYHTIVYYYFLMFLLAGFYIGAFTEMLAFTLLNAAVTVAMLADTSYAELYISRYMGIIIMIAFTAVAIMTSRYYHYIVEKKALFAIRTLGEVDRLTNLLNRRGFEEKLSQIWGQWSDSRKTVLVVMIDIDHFKNYNDTYGHVAGDQCLKDISESIYDIAARKTEFVVRYGGEEFVIVLTDYSQEEGIEIALNVQERIASLHIKAGEMATHPEVTVSMGIADMKASPSNSIYELIEKADTQLYFSKNNGRNKITMNSREIMAENLRASTYNNY
ncbi:GGDEF domain-containing protein [Konateibacter massiliensis]|uniref:GGDEF domain-containing protein n=1 Tax=Konateibacter massiliensis TaxID=2002841 RepID=UPI0015D5008A|nr:GGDEF domain-containing protein [Konateibacter massiliensis]